MIRKEANVILSIVDRDRKEEERVVKQILCKDALDADRIKRLFFRVLNTKLNMKSFGYETAAIDAEKRPRKSTLKEQIAQLTSELHALKAAVKK